MMRILLISATGKPYFAHCKQEIADFLGLAKRVAFVTAASLYGESEYFRAVYDQLVLSPQRAVSQLLHLCWDANGLEVLNKSDAVFVGGGNTFALLQRLKQIELLAAIREKVSEGLPYIGSSAGANIVGPNILTTNDWNVVGLTDFCSLGLVPFNINPHYIERGSSDAPFSETRDERIREYHQVRNNPVVAIEENALIRVTDGVIAVRGKGRVKVFTPSTEPRWLSNGQYLDMDIYDTTNMQRK